MTTACHIAPAHHCQSSHGASSIIYPICCDRETPGNWLIRTFTGTIRSVPESAIAALPDVLAALELADKLIRVARQHFPKSIKNSDRFQLENTCAAIRAALLKAATTGETGSAAPHGTVRAS